MEDSIEQPVVNGFLMVELGIFKGYEEKGLLRSLQGKLTGVHKVLCSAAEIACKRRQDFYLGHNGENMIPIQNKIGQGMRIHFEKLLNWHGKNELIPVYLENNILEVKSTGTNNVNNAQQSGSEYGRVVRSQVQRKLCLVMAWNILENLVQMSKWEMVKTEIPESE